MTDGGTQALRAPPHKEGQVEETTVDSRVRSAPRGSCNGLARRCRGRAGGTTGCNDGEVTWTPTSLWPPNHKFVPITITYNDGDNDDTTLTADAVTHDQYVEDAEGNVTEMNGSGNTLVDAQGFPASDDGSGEDNATVTVEVRASVPAATRPAASTRSPSPATTARPVRRCPARAPTAPASRTPTVPRR